MNKDSKATYEGGQFTPNIWDEQVCQRTVD